ncbi:hypothetical protein [Arsenicicoccus dermatophilus]|uniref:hypothetical protein n=1 Tax=Arsenicicoccus dermatophilus TaxID=1076331 RepID=UPI001F4C6E44|nr:hypothetical protein [Arsenicicoccus dermatophilus]MCH8613671.1 hypothetical protein [Arsenicicoccus dermatophilus]
MFDINGGEFLLLIIVAIVVLGPERLPEYAAKLRELVRNVRGYAEGAKVTLREQMGPEFDEIDWRQYDPRQYDPRRIVREALLEDPIAPAAAGGATLASYGADGTSLEPPRRPGHRFDESYTPFDIEAT